MRSKIFLSHAHEDKELVGTIAEELRKVYGEDRIFYDSWSMKPGDNLIKGIAKGLEECEYFFLFMSGGSINKPMVRLEWHEALLDSLAEKSNFIPVRIDDISPPTLLTSTLYIDMYNRGLPQTIEDIKQIVEQKGLYDSKKIKKFSNLGVSITVHTDKLEAKIYAKRLVENETKFAFWSSGDQRFTSLNICLSSEATTMMGSKQIKLQVVQVMGGALTPHSPHVFNITPVEDSFEFQIIQVLGVKPNLIFKGSFNVLTKTVTNYH